MSTLKRSRSQHGLVNETNKLQKVPHLTVGCNTVKYFRMAWVSDVTRMSEMRNVSIILVQTP